MKKVKDWLITLGLLFNIIEEKSETLNLWKSRQAKIKKAKDIELAEYSKELPRLLTKLKNDILNPECHSSYVNPRDSHILNELFDMDTFYTGSMYTYEKCRLPLNKRNVDKIEQAIIKYNTENKENRI